MNYSDPDLSLAHVALHATVAGLAVLGFISIVPVATTPGTFLIVLPVLGITSSAGLLFAGRHIAVRARRTAARDALTDQLTGLSTWHATELVLTTEFAAAQRGRPLSVVVFRIEQFPHYAARHGRPMAERLLRSAGRAMKKHTRDMHTTGLHGRGEGMYVSVLSGVPLDGACTFSKRVRRDLMALPGLPEPLVVSASVVTYDVSMKSAGELVESAERALTRSTANAGKIMVLGQLAPVTA